MAGSATVEPQTTWGRLLPGMVVHLFSLWSLARTLSCCDFLEKQKRNHLYRWKTVQEQVNGAFIMRQFLVVSTVFAQDTMIVSDHSPANQSGSHVAVQPVFKFEFERTQDFVLNSLPAAAAARTPCSSYSRIFMPDIATPTTRTTQHHQAPRARQHLPHPMHQGAPSGIREES